MGYFGFTATPPPQSRIKIKNMNESVANVYLDDRQERDTVRPHHLSAAHFLKLRLR